MGAARRGFAEKSQYCWLIFVGCCFLQAGGMGTVMSCMSLFWVPVSDNLGLLRSEVTTFMTGYFVATVIAMPLAGKLLSTFDVRKVVSGATVGMALVLVCMSRWDSLWQFPLAGFFVGLFGSCLFVLPSASMIGNWFVKKRGTVYGVTMAFSGIAAAIGSPLFNACIEGFGWRSAYLIMALVVLVLILPWSLFVFRMKPEDMGLVPYGYSPPIEEDKEREVVFLRAGVSPRKALFSVSFCCLFLFAGISAFCHSGIENHIPGFALSLGFSSAFGALMVSAGALGSVIDKLVMGMLNDKIGVKYTTFIQIIMVTIGLVGVCLFKSPIVLIASMVLIGTQDSLMSVSVPLLIRELFGSKNYTLIHSWIRVGVGLFGATAASIVGLLFDMTGDFIPAFMFAVGLYVVSTILIAGAYYGRRKLKWEY